MLADRNKSSLTHDVTEAAHQWLDNHGFKPVETEVYCGHDHGKGWYADIAAVIAPTQTELIELKYIPRPPRYEYGKNKNNDTYRERRDAWEALLRPIHRTMTCLVEVKTSRADFRGDWKWKVVPPTDVAYLAVPPGMVKDVEVPEGWGILELRGDLVCQIKRPVPREATLRQHFTVVYNIAVRRDHRTRYADQRESQKRERIEDAERISIDRMDSVIAAVRDIAAGHYRYNKEPIPSIEDVLSYHRIRNSSKRSRQLLGELFGIAADRSKK